MRWRLTGRCGQRLLAVLIESEERHGLHAAQRYHRLFVAVAELLGEDPAPPYSRPVVRVSGVRVVHLKHGNGRVPVEDRVGRPRHLVLYRVGAEGTVELLSLIHDRMSLEPAVRAAIREAR